MPGRKENVMDKKTLLVGEPMGLFIACEEGKLSDINSYSFAVAGAELNVAVGMARLGQKVGYYTKLGDDPFGRRVLDVLRKNKISTELIMLSGEKPTGMMLKSKVSEGDPDIFYFRKNSAASTINADDIMALDLEGYHAVHMTGITPAISESAKEAVFALIWRAKNRGIRLSFDPNLRPMLWQNAQNMRETIHSIAFQSDLFLPGIKEVVQLTGILEPEAAAEFYLNRGVRAIVIKLGANGAYYDDGSNHGYVSGYKIEKIVDTVGAGDGFAAGVLSGLDEGLSLRQAVQWGNAVGALQLTCAGDNEGLPTRRQLETFIHLHT